MNRVEVNYINITGVQITNNTVNFCEMVLSELNISNWEISILFCDNLYIKNLNKNYRSKDEATDVLSFNQDLIPVDNVIYAGDIVISLETVKLHSLSFSVSMDEELKRVIIHGTLHLYGLDHLTNEKNESMLELQERILRNVSGDKII
jgi:probable rRNA maturation factor